MKHRTLFIGFFLCMCLPALGQTPDSSTTSDERNRFFALHPTGTSAPPSFGRIFLDVGRDFKHLPSKDNAMWLGIGTGLAVLAAQRDYKTSQSFHGWSASQEAFEPGAQLGSFYFTMAASFGTYAVGRIAGDSKTARVGADLIRAQIISQSTTQLLKFAANRTRPSGEPRSFPSGHTSSAFAMATVLQRHYGFRVGVPAYAVASYVGASRIQAGKHYLSDVIFGATLGIVAGRTVTIGRAKFEIAPFVTPGGGVGIGFNLAGQSATR